MALRLMPFAWCTAAVGAALLSGQILIKLTPLPNLSLIFLLAVLFSAVSFGIWPAVYASLLSCIAYNYFFIRPLYTLTIAEPYELLSLLIFLAVAVITSALAGRVREQAQIAVDRTRSIQRLYEFTRKLSELTTVHAVADAAAGEIYASLGLPTVVLLEHEGELSVSAASPRQDSIEPMALSAAQWAFASNSPAGAGTSVLPTVPWVFTPLRSRRGPVGVVGAACGAGVQFTSEAQTLLNTLAEQVATALERAYLASEKLSAQAAVETERVRNTLLASISHDFRTPLASILGSTTSLIDYGDRLDGLAKADLLSQIKCEAEGLNEMVRNLLAITRINAGALELRYDWVDLREAVERIVSAARRRGAHQQIETTIPATLPLVRVDAALVEQALSNVLNNALGHTPEDTRISFDATVEPGAVSIRVTDDGPGIPAEIFPRLFEKFVRSRKESETISNDGDGTGLGLAIAKGIVEAHQGSIAAQSPVADGRGTRVLLTFPRVESSS